MGAGDREPVNQQEQADCDRKCPRQVVALPDLRLALADEADCGESRGDRDRDVDQQRPAPGGELGEQPAQHETDCRPAPGDRAVRLIDTAGLRRRA